MQNKPVVEARDLSWVAAPQGEAESWPLLAGLSFAIAAGERVLLTGPSGSGKSTLLRAIAGVLAQTETGAFSGELYVRGRCGLVLQDSANSFVAARLGNEVAFGPENLALPEVHIRERVVTVLNSVGLDFGPHRSVVQLSGGQSQRMALAGVLALSPELLLLDEPLSMLDSAAATTVRDAICATLADSPLTAALIVDHDVAPWAEVVSRVMVLNAEGRIAEDVSIEDFLASRTGEPIVSPQSFDLGYRAANEAGQITAFVGPSGAGKTTELNRRLAKMSVAEVGWVPQQAELTIAGNTVWRSATATVRNLRLDTDLATRLLEQLGLQDQASQNPHLLSGGEMRRLALVSALAHNPSYLILDEPTVGQDDETWRTVAGVILAAKRAGVSVLLATHDSRLIALADEIVQVVAQPVAVTVAPNNGRVAALPALALSLAFVVGSFIVSSVGVALWVLAGEAIFTLACWRILPKQRAKRFAPIAIALASIWLSNAIFAASGVSQAGFERATFVALRTATFVLPSVVLAGALRPIELAASLVRWCRVPARPAMAAAAALVRLELIQWQWAAVRQTRRLRGFAKGRSPVARTREFAASIFALLVQSLRSAGDLAVAMQARGFGEASAKRRTWVKF